MLQLDEGELWITLSTLEDSAHFCNISKVICSRSKRCAISLKVGGDSIIGASSQIADKTSIKRSTIGASTTVKEKVKITNSIIMNGVTIEEGLVLCITF